MKHLFWAIYLLTVMIVGGLYIKEQKTIIAKLEFENQELTASQRPPIVPDKRKIKIVKEEVIKEVPVKDEKCVQAYEELRQKTLQCAYNLQACQNTSEVYSKLKPKEPNGKGDNN